MKIPGGYILQPRCFDDSEAAHFPPVTREIWFFLLRMANHTDHKNIKRGQVFVRNLSEIQDALCWYVGYRKMTYSKPQITKSLRRLCESNMTEKRRTTRGIIVTICNYDFYQSPENYKGNDERTAKETGRKRKGHTIYNNDNNEKNEKNVIKNGRGYQGKDFIETSQTESTPPLGEHDWEKTLGGWVNRTTGEFEAIDNDIDFT